DAKQSHLAVGAKGPGRNGLGLNQRPEIDGCARHNLEATEGIVSDIAAIAAFAALPIVQGNFGLSCSVIMDYGKRNRIGVVWMPDRKGFAPGVTNTISVEAFLGSVNRHTGVFTVRIFPIFARQAAGLGGEPMRPYDTAAEFQEGVGFDREVVAGREVIQ